MNVNTVNSLDSKYARDKIRRNLTEYYRRNWRRFICTFSFDETEFYDEIEDCLRVGEDPYDVCLGRAPRWQPLAAARTDFLASPVQDCAQLILFALAENLLDAGLHESDMNVDLFATVARWDDLYDRYRHRDNPRLFLKGSAAGRRSVELNCFADGVVSVTDRYPWASPNLVNLDAPASVDVILRFLTRRGWLPHEGEL